MSLNYSDILRRAWQITWNNKILWLFGILAGLATSTAAAFSVLVHGARPRLSLVQYILRYLVVTTVVVVAYKLNIVSLTATIIGLCSFVVALFGEALREFYFAIIHREETS